MKKRIYGHNAAGIAITSTFHDHRGYVIQDHQDKVTVARAGHRHFSDRAISTVEQAKRLIDAWEDNPQSSISIFEKLNAVAPIAAQSL